MSKLSYVALLFTGICHSATCCEIVSLDDAAGFVGTTEEHSSQVDLVQICDDSRNGWYGYGVEKKWDGTRYRDAFFITAEKEILQIGVAFPLESSVAGDETTEFLMVSSNDTAEDVITAYLNGVAGLRDCVLTQACAEQLLNSVGFFDKLFNESMRDFAGGLRSSLQTNDRGAEVFGYRWDNESRRLTTSIRIGNKIWNALFRVSRKDELVLVTVRPAVS